MDKIFHNVSNRLGDRRPNHALPLENSQRRRTQLFSDLETFFLNYGLVGIFLATVLAGTFIPLGSPALILATALFGVNPVLLILVGSAGFTIGMMINYALAYRLGRPYVTRKLSAEKLHEIIHLWNRWGWIICTLFGLVPVLPGGTAVLYLRPSENEVTHFPDLELCAETHGFHSSGLFRRTCRHLDWNCLARLSCNLSSAVC